MRFPESWLREWVSPRADSDDLAERLTLLGLEVDSVEPAAPAFSGVVVGLIREVWPHPEGERLHVCRVEDGTDTAHEVVCGAPNAVEGLRVAFARPGAQLPGGQPIERTTVRGVESAGMLCSAKELGLSDDASQLLELDAQAPVGADLRAHEALDEAVFEIDLTPNRGDCLSIRGIAREVAAAHSAPLSEPSLDPVPAKRQDAFPVWLAAPAACPRYAGRVVRGVDPRCPTPHWLAERLRRSGVRPVSALVDITNYVMLELGQPMHAFDLERLSESIEVRWGRSGESLELLDERTVAIDPDTLVIADAQGPVALAGIMGGAGTAVGEGTRDVFLESACFLPHALAGRARRYGTHTDASHRFERGVDPELPVAALERATALIVSICGGEPGPAHDTVESDHMPRRATITLRRRRLDAVLGYAPDSGDVTRLFGRLGLEVTAADAGWQVQVPSWRFDLAIEADLIEEVVRLQGYNRAPRTHPVLTPRIARHPEASQDPDRLRDLLVERDYAEAITYSFVDSRLQALVDPQASPLALANPIASDMDVMRTSLWPGLLRALQYNRNRQQGRVRLFELGRRFRPGSDGALEQADMLAGVVDGPVIPEQWGATTRNADFFDVKGDIEALLASADRERFTFVAAEHSALHPGQSARIDDTSGASVGWLGTLHPRLQSELDLERAPLLFELRVDPLRATRLPAYRAVSRYPAIRRDLAVIVDENLPAGDVLATVRRAAPDVLREAFVFDVYQGKGVDSGRKSLALGLILQGLSRTLTDRDVEEGTALILDALRSSHGATLRE